MNCYRILHQNFQGCTWLRNDIKSNTTASIFAGILFGMGWWIIIDGAATYPNDLPKSAHICGVLSTISFFMVNSISNAQLNGMRESRFGTCGARAWIFISLVIAFLSLITAVGIVAYFIHSDDKPKWPGIAVFLQNSLIFSGLCVFKFGRTEREPNF